MVYLKNIFKIMFAFIIAFSINEMFVRHIIGYPTFGLDKKLSGIRSAQGGWQNIWIPHSYYWNVEGGNIVEKRNNYGLPGEDVNIDADSKIIFLLGDSYSESLQVKKESMASTIFQNSLNQLDKKFKVINLSCSGHDPYDLYLRTKYYSSIFNPEWLILILESDKLSWIQRNKNIDFKFDINNVNEMTGLSYNLQKILRNNSSSLNLFIYNLLSKENSGNLITQGETQLTNSEIEKKDYSILTNILKQYVLEYKNRFIIVSVSPDEELNKELKNFSHNYNAKIFYENLLEKEYRFSSHLNESGNSALGNLLFNSFRSVISQK